jgi:hypothetical protein
MTVCCEGDRWPMEQFGERQDFELELTRQGFRHEDFVLQVLKDATKGAAEWSAGYSVTVANVTTERCRIYRGGLYHRWVLEFARDLADDRFGEPSFTRARAVARCSGCDGYFRQPLTR